MEPEAVAVLGLQSIGEEPGMRPAEEGAPPTAKPDGKAGTGEKATGLEDKSFFLA